MEGLNQKYEKMKYVNYFVALFINLLVFFDP